MCQEAPVARRCWEDAQRRWNGVYFLGIIGDQAHQSSPSSHNCAPMQESPLNGESYHPEYAHALDIGHGGAGYKAAAIRKALLADERTRYVIDRGVGYYGKAHPKSGTFASSGHHTHVHASFMPGTTFDTRPFFGNKSGELPKPLRRRLERRAHKLAKRRPRLEYGTNQCIEVRRAQKLLGFPMRHRNGRFGHHTLQGVQKFQGWLNASGVDKLRTDGVIDERTWKWLIYGRLIRDHKRKRGL